MKRFIIKISAWVLGVCLCLSLLSYMADRGLRKTDKWGFSINKYIQGGMNHDMLILGSSRAWVHVSPQIMDSILLVDSYNMGEDGTDALVHIELFRLYDNHNPPVSSVVYCVDEIILEKNLILPQGDCYPQYINHPIIKRLSERYNYFSAYNYIIPFTKYISNKNFITGLMEFFHIKHYTTNKVKGYEGQLLDWDNSFDDFKLVHKDGYHTILSQECMREFEIFVQELKDRNIQLILTWSPQYYEAKELSLDRQEALSFYQSLVQKYNVSFLDYSEDSICYNKDYFYNSQHMNKKGAELFTEKLAKDIKLLQDSIMLF